MEHSAADSRSLLLTVNGGSSSIKFALFEPDESLRRRLEGSIDRIGSRAGTFRVNGALAARSFTSEVSVPNSAAAVAMLMDWIEARMVRGGIGGAGHRVVHGGPRHLAPQRITPAMVEELRGLAAFDPGHLPEELMLIDELCRRYPELPQVACFDTAFHRDLPRVARLFPIPRRYEEEGVRRYGFHGLSYSFLMEELARVGGDGAAGGRVVLAHLGSGASLCAVRDGHSIDTTMGFTPTGGVPMGTRSGDLDPGLAWYLAQTERMTPERFNTMVTRESGLLGLSATSSDVRDLLARESGDPRAADAVAVFCYQVRKGVGALAAALGGLDTLVFAGGIGENSPPIRARICDGLGFLGVEIDPEQNAGSAAVISPAAGRVTVRVIRTDEELMIARETLRVLSRASEIRSESS